MANASRNIREAILWVATRRANASKKPLLHLGHNLMRALIGERLVPRTIVLKNLCGALTSGSGYHFGAMTIAEKQSQTACFLCCLYRALAAIGHCVMLKTHNKPQYVQFGKGWLRPLRGSRGKQFEIVPFPHPLTAQEAGKALQDWKGAVVEEDKTSKPSTGQ